MTRPDAPELTVAVRNFSAKPVVNWRHVLDQAKAADDAGVDRVFVSDHVVFGPDLTAYSDPQSGGRVGGQQPTGPDGEWIEALTMLSALSAVTERVKLATNILVAPLRRPVVLAKVAASIDVLSRGRFELGVGIGWQEAEYRAMGVEFRRRGRALDELLEVCAQLWAKSEVDYHGEGFELVGIHMMPKPTRKAGVPVWIGGTAKPVVARRLVKYGVGWIPWGVDPYTYMESVDQMRDLVTAEGGDFESIQVAYPLAHSYLDSGRADYEAMFARVPELVRHGVTDFRTLMRVPAGYDEALDVLSEAAQEFRVVTHDRAQDDRSSSGFQSLG